VMAMLETVARSGHQGATRRSLDRSRQAQYPAQMKACLAEAVWLLCCNFDIILKQTDNS